jgi:hypothetical protein
VLRAAASHHLLDTAVAAVQLMAGAAQCTTPLLLSLCSTLQQCVRALLGRLLGRSVDSHNHCVIALIRL